MQGRFEASGQRFPPLGTRAAISTTMLCAEIARNWRRQASPGFTRRIAMASSTRLNKRNLSSWRSVSERSLKGWEFPAKWGLPGQTQKGLSLGLEPRLGLE